MEWCFNHKGTENFKSATSAATYTDHQIPPVARLDRYLELDANGSVTVDVLANDFDTNGDDIAIKAFDTQSELGGTVSFVAANNESSRDRLHYSRTISATPPDSCGALCNSSDLLLWLDASDNDTLVDINDNTGDAIVHQAQIKKWLDKSSHGNHAEIYASPSHPEVHRVGRETLNGKQALYFNEDLMEIRTLDVSKYTLDEVTSIAVTYHRDGYPAIWVQKGNGDGGRFHNVSSGKTVLSKIYEINAASEWKGMLPLSNEAVSPQATGKGIGLGAQLYAWENYPGAYHSSMSFAELLIFNRKLTQQERQHVETYLVKKWSLDISDRFTYTITDDTGQTSQGLVYVPIEHEEKPDLTALDGKLVYIRNRNHCDWGWVKCDWHVSFYYDGLLRIEDKNNLIDLVAWQLNLVPNTTNQFTLTNTWGCPGDARCNQKIIVNKHAVLEPADTAEGAPFEFTFVPGVDQSGPIKEFYIHSKHQCGNGGIHCNSPVINWLTDHVILDYPFREGTPWSVELLP
jgi:hypothetical protein